MSEQPPSKEVASAEHALAPVQYGWLHIPDTARGTDTPAWVRLGDYLKLQNGHKILSDENDRFRKQIAELSVHAEKWVKRATTPAHEREPPHCSTCACGLAPEPRVCECVPLAPRPYNFCQDCGGRITPPPGAGR